MIDYKKFQDPEYCKLHDTIKFISEDENKVQLIKDIMGRQGYEVPHRLELKSIGWKILDSVIVLYVYCNIKFKGDNNVSRNCLMDFISVKSEESFYDEYGTGYHFGDNFESSIEYKNSNLYELEELYKDEKDSELFEELIKELDVVKHF